MQDSGPARRLRVFNPESASEHDFSQYLLREVFERWFVPNVLGDRLERDRPAAAGTLAIYRDAIGYWEKLTRNPPTGEINDADVRQFVAGLQTVSWRRGKFGIERPLSEASKAKHIASIRSLLGKLVDDHASRGAALPVIPKRIRLRKPAVHTLQKPTPPLAQFFSIMTALKNGEGFDRLFLPAPAECEPRAWWRALLGTIYAHGWRLQTAMAIRKSMISFEEVERLRVPGEIVFKTYKPANRPVPPWLRQLWDEARVDGPFILGKPCTCRWLLENWHRIQRAAGVKANFSLHSIRRLHAREVGMLGLGDAQAIAREALQHSDGETTRAHYADFLEAAILRLRPVA